MTKKQIEKKVEELSKYSAEDVLNDVEVKLNMLKEAFANGKNMTGEITLEDVRYNIDCVTRILKHKFKK
jgi:hypothetical protein